MPKVTTHERKSVTWATPGPQKEEPDSSISKITWDQLHSDPILDVVLTSSDEVYFRASSYILARETGLFKGMFGLEFPIYMSASDAVPLDYRATHIRTFLNSYGTPNPPEYSSFNLPFLYELRDFIDYLDCDRLRCQISIAFEEKCSRDPLAWLRLASKHDDLETAALALNQCRIIASPLTADKIFTITSSLRSRWRYRLLRHMMVRRPDLGRGVRGPARGVFEVQWPDAERVKAFVQDVKSSANT